MDNLDLSVLRQVAAWLNQDRRVVLGTITRSWGSAPRPVGSLVAVCDDGQIAGSVSGGCIEDDLIAQVREGALNSLAMPHLLRYGVGAEEAKRFGLPCGGTLELLLEPLNPASQIEALLARLACGERVQRVLDRQTGAVQLLAPQAGADVLVLSEARLITQHGPQWRLLIIGAGQMTHYLAGMALGLDYQVLVCDPREEYAQGWALPGARLSREMPDDAVTAFAPDGHSAIVALTHDPKLDDLALLEALQSPAFYVGAIGSRVNQAKRKARLQEHFGLSEDQLARLHGPVGLNIGARTPPEIALAILAHMTAERYGVKLTSSASGVSGESGCVV
ncbi:xanthine dehydrogenase accessory factor [Paucibacter oligotrophus]|uniref:Xanthine dehydrogenase accessory factor n=1 Tax=Roseateles oligotrophus TaxID=1769250 RepID=A0A840L462_9BURK|nr:XdhC family protein [Roseateles oligotrophus]MBB4843314.1 xanthine dehydrogenase accessory factor [Roseateles oligotrophus]